MSNAQELLAGINALRDEIKAGQEVFANFKGAAAATEKRVDEIKQAAYEATESGAGLKMARVVRAFACAKGNWESVPAVISDIYHDKPLAQDVTKTLSGLTNSAGGYLVAEKWSGEIIPLLRANTVCFKAGARAYPMTNAIEHVPQLVSGSTAYWYGDTDVITASQPAFGQKTMRERYLGALVAISNNLLRSSTPAADQIVRDDIVQVMAIAMDSAALQGSGTGNEPAGVKNASPQAWTVAARLNPDSPIDALELLQSANVQNMVSPAWVFNSRVWRDLMYMRSTTGEPLFQQEMMQNKTLLGVPYFVTSTIANAVGGHELTDIYLGDFNELLVGERVGAGMQLAMSDSAAYFNGTSVISAFQANMTLIRASFVGDILVRQNNAFVVSSDVWTA